MAKSNMDVVIVGINEYNDEDVTDLRGARNDAIAWWRLCTGYLNIAPQRITVLASPPITPAELGETGAQSHLGAATHEAIVEAMNKLANSVAANDGGGLVTFSGHGVAAGPVRLGDEGEDLALCPEDVLLENGVADRLVRFAMISKLFANDAVRDAVTVIVDTCYTRTCSDVATERGLVGALLRRQGEGAGPKLRKKLAASKGGRVAMALASAKQMSTRLILGSEHWAPAHEIRIGNEWRGACSWALATLMEQWARRNEGGTVFLNVSYRHLLKRAADLLAAMGLTQVPVLWGLRRVDNIPMLRPGFHYEPGETSYVPDGLRGDKQIPVDVGHWVTTAFLSYGTDFAYVVAVGNTAFTVTASNGSTFTFEKNKEYWYANDSADLSGMADWSKVNWRCHSSCAYSDAEEEVLSALASISKQPNDVAWTASRTSYSWLSGSANLSYANSSGFGNTDSGIVVGTNSDHRLDGIVIFNGDNTTTWPDSRNAMSEGQNVAFNASAVGDLPDYHYKFAT